MKQYINHQAEHKQFDDYMKEKPCKNDKKMIKSNGVTVSIIGRKF